MVERPDPAGQIFGWIVCYFRRPLRRLESNKIDYGSRRKVNHLTVNLNSTELRALVASLLLCLVFAPTIAVGQWQGWENLSLQPGGGTIVSPPTVIQVGREPVIYAVGPEHSLLWIQMNHSTPSPAWN
jgi:hypothetical protein